MTDIAVRLRGAGKSTLLPILMGLVRPDTGEVTAHGPVATFLGGGRTLEQAFLDHVGAVAPRAGANGHGRAA